MKKQMLSLMLGAAVLATNPAFAMQEDGNERSQGLQITRKEPTEYSSPSLFGFGLEEVLDEFTSKTRAEELEKCRAEKISNTLAEMGKRHRDGTSQKLAELKKRHSEEAARDRAVLRGCQSSFLPFFSS